MILIVGHKGVMGRRYSCILNYLGKKWIGTDIDGPTQEFQSKDISGIIIATPTETHAALIKVYAEFGKPILAEKPICKDLNQLKEVLYAVKDIPFEMVYQYKQIARLGDGPSHYNYWNHGRDGLHYDCIQIIGLARGPVELAEDSPIWDCRINGDFLFIEQMDFAYVSMIKNWLKKPGMDLNEIYAIHEKVHDMVKSA